MFLNHKCLEQTQGEAKDDQRKYSTVSCVRLPNYSDRFEVVHSKGHCFYDKITQRVVREHFDVYASKVIGKAVHSFLRVYLRMKFLYWYHRINRDFVSRRTYKRYYPKLIWDNVTDLWPYRKGLQLIVGYYLEAYRKHIRNAMRRWKMYIREIRMLLFHILGKWRVKTSRIVLNRMNAARFLHLTRNLGRKIRLALRRYYWPIFRYSCDLVLIRRHVRLLFRCWHTVVDAMRRGRRMIKRRALQELRDNVLYARQSEMDLIALCKELQDRYRMKRNFIFWLIAYRNRNFCRRVLLSYCRSSIWRAWAVWKRNAFYKPLTRTTPTPRPPPVPVPHTYKRRGSRLPRVPPHIVVPLMGLQSYALVHDPKRTKKDRIEFRIHRAVKLDLKEEAREKPEILADVLSHSHFHSHSVVHDMTDMCSSFRDRPKRSSTPEGDKKTIRHSYSGATNTAAGVHSKNKNKKQCGESVVRNSSRSRSSSQRPVGTSGRKGNVEATVRERERSSSVSTRRST